VLDIFLERFSLLPVSNGYLGVVKMDSVYLKKLSTQDEKALYGKWCKYCKTSQDEFILDEKTRKADTFVCHSGLWNKNEKLKAYIAGKDFIDAGAYIGDTALVYLRHYAPKKVWSFEISELARKRYEKNLIKNNIQQELFSLVPMGLSDQSYEILFQDTGVPGTNMMGTVGSGCLARLTDLDSFAEKHKLCVGFIKADVEGAGAEALRGMTRTIQKDRPVLSLAIYHTPVEFFEMKPLLDQILDGLDYRVTVERHWPFASEMLEIVIFAYPRELS